MDEMYLLRPDGDPTTPDYIMVRVIGNAPDAVSLKAKVLGRPDPNAGNYALVETPEGNREAVVRDALVTAEEAIAASLSDEDIAAWHEGELTENTAVLVKHFGTFQVWGSHDGPEPLSVTLL